MVGGGELVSIAGALVSLVNVVGSVGSQFVEHPEDRYGEKVKDLQDDRWNDFTTELGELVHEIEQQVDKQDQTNDDGESVPPDAAYGFYIYREYERGDLDGLADKIDAIDDPRAHFERCRNARDDYMMRFIIGSIVGFVSFITGVGFLIWNDITLLSLSSVFAGIALYATISGGLKVKTWHESRKKLDSMWEDLEFM